MSNVKDIVEKVNVDIVKQIMKDNGAVLYKEKGNELWYNTICHGGDSHKLCYYIDNKNFHCYTNCGQMSLVQFIMNIKECSFGEALNYLKTYTGTTISKGFWGAKKVIDVKEKDIINNRELTQSLQNQKLQGFNNFYKESVLKRFEEIYYQGWIDEGISIPSMEKFGIKWYEREKHIIIPHRDIDGHLIGIRRRSLKPEDSKNKYMPEIIGENSYGHSLGMNLYGLYENQKAIKKYKIAVIVEGEKSVLLSDTYFGENSCAVATCGFNISKHQIDLLLDTCGVNKIFLAFDKDFEVLNYHHKYAEDDKEYKDIQKYLDKLNSLSEKFGKYFDVKIIIDRESLLKIKDSPLDRGKDTFLQLQKYAIPNKITQKDLILGWKKKILDDDDDIFEEY